MGNCAFKIGYNSSAVLDQEDEAGKQNMIKVVTSTGGIMELYAPITAEQITSEFPGHGLFLSPDATMSNPLLHKDHLHAGQLYYLLPLSSTKTASTMALGTDTKVVSTPYRMSFDAPKVVYKRSSERHHADTVVPRYNGTGVWKVRLVINPEQLSEILSQEARTEELIESVRTVAKCGTSTGSSGVSTSSCNNSDQSSVSSCNFNWKASL